MAVLGISSWDPGGASFLAAVSVRRSRADARRGGPGGQRRRLRVDGGAQLLLQLDEGRHRRVGRQPAGDLEDLGQRPVALLLIGRQGRGLLAVGVQRPVKRDGQELGVAEGVADAVGGDGVTVVAGVPDQGPARPERLAQLVGLAEHALDR